MPSWIHLYDREKEWALNAATGGAFSVELQRTYQSLVEGNATSAVVSFGTEDLQLTAVVKRDDIELSEWDDDGWNKLSEVPPPWDNQTYLVEYAVRDYDDDPVTKRDVVRIKQWNDNPSEIVYYSMFNKAERRYGIEYDCPEASITNSIRFKRWK